MSDYGKDRLANYTEVKDRIPLFYEKYPDGRLVTEDVQLTTEPDGIPRVIVKAAAYRTVDDPHPGTGHSWMLLPGSTPYTRGSEIENTETSAWGRAIGSLGIGIDKSIGSKDEIDGKAGEGDRKKPADTGPDGLIGTVITQGTQDFELRQSPDGYRLPFRLKNGNSSFICIAEGPLAEALSSQRGEVIGQRVTVWGRWEDQEFPKGKQTITYRVLHVERIKSPEWMLPIPSAVSPLREPEQGEDDPTVQHEAPVEGQVAAFDLAESARIDAEAAAQE